MALDGQEDLDDAVGNAMACARCIRAAGKRPDLGDPDRRDPLSLHGPRLALAKADPMTRGALLMALTGGLATESRLHRDGRIADPRCRWCGAANGDAEHHLRKCSNPTPTQQRLEPERRAAETALSGPGGAPAAERPIWTRGLYPAAIASWNTVALAAAAAGMNVPCDH